MLFDHSGEMGRLIGSYPWADHVLGDISQWPQSLISAAGICLNSNFPIAIYWGKDLHLIYNDAWSPIPGSKHPWAIGRPAKEVWPDIWTDIAPLFEEAMNTGRATGSKDALLPMNRHGYVEECYFDFTFTPIFGEEGTVAGIFNAVIETTYRVINERRGKLLNQLTAGISSSGTHTDLYAGMAGVLESALIDIPFCSYACKEKDEWKSQLTVNANETRLAELFSRINDEGSILHFSECDAVQSVAKQQPWPEEVREAVYVPVFMNGEVAGGFIFGISSRLKPDEEYMAFLQSIASLLGSELQRRDAFVQQKKRADALEAIDHAKTVFFSNISHEFRTPITLMLGPLEEEINQPSGVLSEKSMQHIETAHRNAMRLLKLVNGLLDFSRIESGRQQVNYTLTDIVTLTKNLSANFQSVIERAGLSFEVKADSFIQPVYVDVDMWEKIIFNLLSNAFKFTLKGSIIVWIGADEANVIVQVMDTGIGIPEHELPNLFQRFHRIENTGGRTFEGTGIGLSMIKELVKLLGGTIDVESRLGIGTTFTVLIPFGKNHIPKDMIRSKEESFVRQSSDAFIAEAKSLLEETGEVSERSENTAGEYILVVDDNADMREHLRSLLQTEYQVATAANGLEALHRVNEKHPALILSDIMMPIRNGIELLRDIKLYPQTKHIPVILLSARAGEESRIEGYETGADDYLVKPFSSKELFARIRAQLKLQQIKTHAEQRMLDVFTQAPTAIAIFKGTSMVFEFANDAYVECTSRSRAELIGHSLFDALPETKETLQPIAMKIMQTGESFSANELELRLKRDGKEEQCFFNTIWTPLRDGEKNITGVICCAFEVTQYVASRMKP